MNARNVEIEKNKFENDLRALHFIEILHEKYTDVSQINIFFFLHFILFLIYSYLSHL